MDAVISLVIELLTEQIQSCLNDDLSNADDVRRRAAEGSFGNRVRVKAAARRAAKRLHGAQWFRQNRQEVFAEVLEAFDESTEEDRMGLVMDACKRCGGEV